MVKLELRHKVDVSTLCISEEVTKKDVQILRVGIDKMASSGAFKIIVDFSKAKLSQDLTSVIRNLQISGFRKGALVIFAGENLPIALFKTGEIAETVFFDPKKIQLVKTKIYNELSGVTEKNRQAVEEKLEKAEKELGKIEFLEAQIDQMQEEVKTLEKQVTTLFKGRDSKDAGSVDVSALNELKDQMKIELDKLEVFKILETEKTA